MINYKTIIGGVVTMIVATYFIRLIDNTLNK